VTRVARRFDGKTSVDDAVPAPGASSNPRMCRVEDCSSRLDGSDGLCGYHRALRQGPDALQVWRDARHDWRTPLFEDFRERHEDDSWGAAINASERMATASLEEQRDFLNFLKRQARSAVRRVPSA